LHIRVVKGRCLLDHNYVEDTHFYVHECVVKRRILEYVNVHIHSLGSGSLLSTMVTMVIGRECFLNIF